MKLSSIIRYAGWISGAFGALLMLAGIIGFFIGGEFLGVQNFYNYFWFANSFFFLGIFCVIVSGCCCCCCKEDEKCSTTEEKK